MLCATRPPRRAQAKWADCVAIARTAAQASAAAGGGGGKGGAWVPSSGSTPAALVARLTGVPLKARRGGSGEGGGGGGLASRPTAQVSANTVDVRGEYAEAAIEEVERALSRATQYGALYVIHGHGTGRLREAVRVALREHPFVERLEDAPDNKGGRGCTVAFLRG